MAAVNGNGPRNYMFENMPNGGGFEPGRPQQQPIVGLTALPLNIIAQIVAYVSGLGESKMAFTRR